jgi:hypothetical protein
MKHLKRITTWLKGKVQKPAQSPVHAPVAVQKPKAQPNPQPKPKPVERTEQEEAIIDSILEDTMEQNLLTIPLQVSGSTVELPETDVNGETERVLSIDGKQYRITAGRLPIGQMLQTATKEGDEIRMSISGFYGTLSGSGSVPMTELTRVVEAVKNGSRNITFNYLDKKVEKSATVTFEPLS